MELSKARSFARLGKLSAVICTLCLMVAATGCNGGTTPPTSIATEPATVTVAQPATATIASPLATPTGTAAAEPESTISTSPVATPTGTAAAQPGAGQANADVVHVRAVQAQDSTWTFHVTVEHPDTGWDDYADGWDVVTPDGQVLKPDEGSQFTRTLLHPHENEQPFTRSQSGIAIPDGVTEVRVRAHDLVDGYGGREVVVDLTAGSGPSYEVERQ